MKEPILSYIVRHLRDLVQRGTAPYLLVLLQRCLLLALVEKLLLVTWTGHGSIEAVLAVTWFKPDWIICYVDSLVQLASYWVLLNLVGVGLVGWQRMLLLHRYTCGLTNLCCIALGVYAGYVRMLHAYAKSEAYDVEDNFNVTSDIGVVLNLNKENIHMVHNFHVVPYNTYLRLPLSIVVIVCTHFLSFKVTRYLQLAKLTRRLVTPGIPLLVAAALYWFSLESCAHLVSLLPSFMFRAMIQVLFITLLSILLSCGCFGGDKRLHAQPENDYFYAWLGFSIVNIVVLYIPLFGIWVFSLSDFTIEIFLNIIMCGALFELVSAFNAILEEREGNELVETCQQWIISHWERVSFSTASQVFLTLKLGASMLQIFETNGLRDTRFDGWNLANHTILTCTESCISLLGIATAASSLFTQLGRLIGFLTAEANWRDQVNIRSLGLGFMILSITYRVTEGVVEERLKGLQYCALMLFYDVLFMALDICFMALGGLMQTHPVRRHLRVLFTLALLLCSSVAVTRHVKARYGLTAWVVTCVMHGVTSLALSACSLAQYLVLQLDALTTVELGSHADRHRNPVFCSLLQRLVRLPLHRMRHMDTDSLVFASRSALALCSITHAVITLLCLLWSAALGESRILLPVILFLSAYQTVWKRLRLEWRSYYQQRMMQKLIGLLSCASSTQLQQLQDECCICMSPLCPATPEHSVTTPCRHFFHRACLRRWFFTSLTCPMCQTHVFCSTK